MAILTPIHLAGYAKVNECKIDDVSKSDSAIGRALRASFMLGPSGAVISDGVIHISSHAPQGIEDLTVDDDKKDGDNPPTPPAPGGNPPAPNGGNPPAPSGGSESYHYSIYEAYLSTLHPIYEDGEGGNPPAPDGGGDNPPAPDGGDNPPTPDDSDNPPNPDEDNGDKNDGKFKPGKKFFVQVLLEKEGCTVWHIQFDSRISDNDIFSILKQIINKKFKLAYNTAHKGLSGAGMAILSASTFLYKDAVARVPFIGHCRYAMDSGSEHAEDDANTVVIAIAPINGITKKPSESIVYKVTYDITGDISNGKLPFLKKLKDNDGSAGVPTTANTGDSEESTISGAVSKWLNDNYKCVGDHTTFKNFKKLRDFVVDNESDKKLEFNSDDSEDPKHYAMISALKNNKCILFY